MSQRKPGDALFTTLAATAAVVATLITLWIGRGIARMGHDGGGAHEAAPGEGAAKGEAH